MGSETLDSICCKLSGESVYPFTLRVAGINTITLAMRCTRTLKMQFAFSQKILYCKCNEVWNWLWWLFIILLKHLPVFVFMTFPSGLIINRCSWANMFNNFYGISISIFLSRNKSSFTFLVPWQWAHTFEHFGGVWMQYETALATSSELSMGMPELYSTEPLSRISVPTCRGWKGESLKIICILYETCTNSYFVFGALFNKFFVQDLGESCNRVPGWCKHVKV